MKSNLDNDTKIILGILEDYKKIEDEDVQNVNWRRIFIKASLNRVDYQFAKKIINKGLIKNDGINEQINDYIKTAEIEMQKLKRTVKYIDKKLASESIEYLTIKTNRGIPYITLDVDIVVQKNDFERAKLALTSESAEFKGSNPEIQPHIHLPNQLLIDLHRDISWWYHQNVDQDKVWNTSDRTEIQGINVPCIGLEMEILLMISHTLRERLQITLLDFLFLKNNLKIIDWDFIVNQTQKYGWYDLFLDYMGMFNSLYKLIYHEENNFISEGINKKKINTPITMPYIYPIKNVLKVFYVWGRKSNYFPWFETGYFFFALLRYHLSKKQKVPIYRDWYSFKEKW